MHEGLKRIFALFSVCLRLLLAFACGWFLAFLVAKSYSSGLVEGSFLFFLTFPPVLGIAAVGTVNRRNTYLTSLSIWTGLFVIAGVYVYWLPIALYNDAVMNAECAAGLHCHIGAVEVFLLNLFLFYGVVLVLPGAIITSRIIKQNLKRETLHQMPERTNKNGIGQENKEDLSHE